MAQKETLLSANKRIDFEPSERQFDSAFDE